MMEEDKIPFFISIDVENPQTPYFNHKFDDNRILSNGWGIEKIIEILAENDVKGIFFVNVYEVVTWGKEELGKILKLIHNSGNEVGLHTHPIWMDEKRREFIHEFSIEEQEAIIKYGKDLIENLIGSPVYSHRAGGYGFNDDTIEACKRNNIYIDSSNYFSHKNCKTIITKNKFVEYNSVLEIPINVIEVGNEYQKIDLDWFNLDQFKQIFTTFEFESHSSLMFHSYSLTNNSSDYSQYTPSEEKVKKLGDLIKYLKGLDKFEFLTYRDYYKKNVEVKKSLNIKTENKQIVFVKKNPQVRIFKQAWALKKRYPDFELILVAKFCDIEFFKNIFDKIIIVKDDKELESVVKLLTPLIFHAHAEPNLEPSIVIANSQVPVIYDVYDFSGLRYGIENLNEAERSYEKYSLENADAVVFKFKEDILDYYRSNGYNIKSPVLTYLDYCIDDYLKFNNPISDKYSLVYAGVLNPSELPENKFGNNQYIRFVKSFISQQLFYHIYINVWQTDVESKYWDYLELEKKSDYFKFNFSLPQDKLQAEISKLHFGTSFHDFSKTNHHPLFGETSIGNKLSTYLEAGIPVIVGKNLKYNSEVVENLGVGFSIELDEIDNLSLYLKEIDFAKLKSNVFSVREKEFSAYKQVEQLMKFYKILQ